MAEKEITKAKKNNITVVAEDKNWRSYVEKELASAESWHNDWGFLAGGAIECKFSLNFNFFAAG